MSCWRRTTVLRIPAIYLGFEYWEQWRAFLRKHEEDLSWDPGYFSSALCEDYLYEDYDKWIRDNEEAKASKRLDLGLFPQYIKTVPGPFLDYYLDEICPLSDKENTYGSSNCARPLTEKEKKKYLPVFRKLFPDFTMEQMEKVHYCRYEWYDGCEAAYYY